MISRTASGMLAAVSLILAMTTAQSCEESDNEAIVFETETFTLSLGNDATVKSLVIKDTGEEMISKNSGVSLFSVTQERPFNNEIKLEHPNTRTTYVANSLEWDGERLTAGFDTAPYKAKVKVDIGSGYLRFTLEDFVCGPGAYGLMMDTPPVAEFRILQLPVKEREHYGEWLNAMWDEKSAVCVAACDPWSEIWHEDRDAGRMLTADLYSGKKLRGGSAAIIAAAGKEPFMDAMDKFEEDLDLPRGVRSRRSPMLNRSIYWTGDATPENIDRHIATAKQAGLKMMLFYYTCFIKSNSNGYGLLGDYDIRDEYPEGYDSIKQMLDKVKAAGIIPGFHTLQTHVGVNSRYVTPAVDSRLNRKRLFTLKQAIPASGDITEIMVEENPVDSPMHDSTRKIAFGGEAFDYESYTTEPPYRFTGVKRGAYETAPAVHPKGEIGGVLDVSEFGATSIYINQDNDLQDEIAEKIADIYDCGMEFLYLDGSEGVNSPCGINVSLAQYRVACKLGKMPIFTEGAAKSHFGWHLQAGANAFDIFPPEIFEEKIIEFPYAEAKRMADNMTRVDFGWWHIYPDTTPEMWDFAESKAAECHCPVTIQFSFRDLEANPHADELLEVLKKWEEYRENEN